MTDNDRQTEEKIFEAATEVFLEKGMDGARMQDIADRAGINKALLHYYFRTKDHLFDAVFEKKAGEMFKKFAPVFDDGLSLEDKIRLFFREHITFLQENPRLPAFVVTEINRNPDRIKKLLKNVDFNAFWFMVLEKHKNELKKYNISKDNLPQLMISMVGISVFPFAARGILEGIMEKMDIDFESFIEERKMFAADFVINAITKK
ncbi:MAG TPA: TetR/AcrR family transcriptional regulator [Bacteroidales bacterium]|nr:TetR/AcrR family transcriptional regulator [Bacteroidales bacterium]